MSVPNDVASSDAAVGNQRDVSRTALMAQPAAVAGAALLGAGLVAWLDLGRLSFLPPCPFLALTGLWCPFCGGTRAVDALAGGDVAGALGLNAVVVVAVPLVAAEWVRWTAGRARGRPSSFLNLPGRALAVVAVVVVLYALLRNIPGLEMLAPPAP